MKNKLIYKATFILNLILIYSQITLASRYNNISIEENILPGAFEISISSDKNLNILSLFSEDSSIVLDVENLSVRRSITHKFKKIPFIRSITIQNLSAEIGKVTISMNGPFSFDILPEVDGDKLTVVLSGEFVDYAAFEKYEVAEKHRRAGNSAAALENYRTAIRLRNGDYPKAYFGIGQVRKQNNQYDLAIISFSNSLQDSELKEDAHLHLAELYGKIERFDLQELHFSLSKGEVIESPELKSIDFWVNQLIGLKISWETVRAILLAVVLLSPLMMLVVIFWRSRGKNKVIPVSKRFKEELEKQLQPSITAKTVEGVRFERETEAAGNELSDKYIDDYTDIDIHLKSIPHKYKQNSHEIIKTIRTLSEENNSTKLIAQKLLISESEVEIIQGMNETSYDSILEGITSLGRLPDTHLSSRELAKELHRDEEGLMLAILADEKGNG